MQKVKINFENCFGIKRFRETLNFQEHKCVLIYAPNGTMKTSFAETLRMIGAEKSNQIKDRMNPSKPVVCEPLLKYCDWYYSTGRYTFPITKKLVEISETESPSLPCLHDLREKQKAVFPYDLYEC